MSQQGVGKYFIFIKNRVTCWKDLAWCLGFTTPDIKNISSKPGDDKDHCMELLQEWLITNGNAATIQVLIQALQDVDQQLVVDNMKDKYPELRCSGPVLPAQLHLAPQTTAQEQTGDKRHSGAASQQRIDGDLQGFSGNERDSEALLHREKSEKLLELQKEVTDIVRADFPNLNFIPDKNKEADERRIELNRRTLQAKGFSSSVNFSLDSVILDLIQERKKSVCRINWPGGSGTGFLLSKGKVLTCYHVYEMMYRARFGSFPEASQYTATFFVSVEKEYEVPFETPAAMLVCHSEDLDYAILQLAVGDEMERNLEGLPLLGHFISESEDSRRMVVIVGHPSGGSKTVDFAHIAGVAHRYIIHIRFPNLIQEDERKPLYDTSAMFHSSSGSPGFDTHGNVALMHSRGFISDSSSPRSIIERGVRLSAIRDHARQTLAPEVFNEIFPASFEQAASPSISE